MRIVYFTHSISSCWNHGNAHFQRGLLRELAKLGHEVCACEPADGWSLTNLVADHGLQASQRFASETPAVPIRRYTERDDVAELIDNADVVVVHEWTDPAIVAELGNLRKRSTGWQLLFHDTHHRFASDPAAMAALDLTGYDGVIAFGRSLAALYERAGWGRRAFVLHEAADTPLFRSSHAAPASRLGVVWVGNWGDGERSAEITDLLLRPSFRSGLTLDVYGVRYPGEALDMLAAHGARYHGWIANADVPGVFARYRMTVHVPRSYYARLLAGIPTIRMFEALACGIPLISAPWDDCDGLFRPGEDYLTAHDGSSMMRAMRLIDANPEIAASLAASGLERIRSRHTCAHRARELLAIVDTVSSPETAAQCA